MVVIMYIISIVVLLIFLVPFINKLRRYQRIVIDNSDEKDEEVNKHITTLLGDLRREIKRDFITILFILIWVTLLMIDIGGHIW